MTFVMAKETSVVSFRITAIRKTRDSSCNRETCPLFFFFFFLFLSRALPCRLAHSRVDVSRRTVKLRSGRNVDAYRPQLLTERNENISTHRACPIKYRGNAHTCVHFADRCRAKVGRLPFSLFPLIRSWILSIPEKKKEKGRRFTHINPVGVRRCVRGPADQTAGARSRFNLNFFSTARSALVNIFVSFV